MIFASRRSRGSPDPHLQTKVVLFSVGAVLALAAIALESSVLAGLAILVLAGGVVLRMLPGGGSGGPEEGPEGSGEEDPSHDGEGNRGKDPTS